SYFFNLYAKKSGVPAVLLLIGLGIIINYSLQFSGFTKPNLLPVLGVLGVVGLILIILEAALDLELVKEKIGLITKSFVVALIGLGGTAFLSAIAVSFLMDIKMLAALLCTIPLSILGSAVILPSIDDVEKEKREFMIYESTFSDILGIIGFYGVLVVADSNSNESLSVGVFSNFFLTVVFSVIISYILIYVFQNIRGHVKLFLLIAVLLLLYAVGKMFHLSSLIIILIFGMMLNNYRVFFKGKLIGLLNEEKVDSVLDDMKIITAETAFVVRTFFFIIFGWSVYLGSLLNLKVIGIGVVVLAIIYVVRAIVLFIFSGKDILLQLFLAPRGLVTILLFFAIPEELKLSLGKEFQGVLLFVVLVSCLIMAWSLISYKKRVVETKEPKGSVVIGDDSETTPTESPAEDIQQ
ncbi:MAG: cation:proton antiporter, partial [Bacteroidota bacterium]|nr:cation:proton antiporter [Bacteroidota bacterium]